MLPSAQIINMDVATALQEDVGAGDLTAQLIPADTRARATVICREEAVLCGQAWFDATMYQVDSTTRVDWRLADGDTTASGTEVCAIEGLARSLLTAERTALNFLQLLSGVATTTRAYATELAETGTRVLDTRKTVPGLRLAQKYAVTCGGGTNHRTGLFDAVLIKENHIMAAGSIKAAVTQARTIAGDRMVEVEVEDLQQLDEALAAGPDRIMLDNFEHDDLVTAVTRARGKVELEASGGVEIGRLRALADTGVDFISVGALTKHVRAIDFSMRFVS